MRGKWRRRLAGVVTAGALAVSGKLVVAQSTSPFKDWKPSVLADALQEKPRTTCAALLSLTGFELSVSTATLVPASGGVPEHCQVLGQIPPEIGFEVRLPSLWNGHLFMFGNGGYAGEALDAPGRAAMARSALTLGFAVAQTNTGHDGAVEPLGTFAATPQKFLDYAYRSVHVTVMSAKKILQTYYEGTLRHSYFNGCSTGGRQGLISAQRFPDDFDGIVVGAPVLSFSGTMVSYAANQRALGAAPISPEKLKILADAVYAKCDVSDGVTDGLIDDPRRCAFKPSTDVPRCAGDADGPDCFTTGQIHALDTIYGGVKRNGAAYFPGWPVGAEIAPPASGRGDQPASGWVPWFVAGSVAGATVRPIQTTFGETFFKQMAFGRPSPSFDWLTFNPDTDLEKLQWARRVLDATDPDLSRFKTRGGKIVSYFGWADPALNPLMGVAYYDSVTQKLGPSTSDFYRMFMIPGMFHCGGGVGVNTLDVFTPLVEWVERGTAPQSIMGSRIVDGTTVRTRPLCPYPEVAKYKGTGSIDEAANFACSKP
ncbi:MAG: tannase/feruloyl esterase family alpha/beta hydrolase [Acidobacteriota bacterium]|nr:tannase/feruloyl esterase family alpha/beta hydrolase [Acidobacteriota bacterium]